MFANLHFHSTHSDGVDSPWELVKIAKSEGYSALALTDHETVTGWEEFSQACIAEGMDFLLGCEFYARGFGTTFHIVGLDFDPRHPEMKGLLEFGKERSYDRVKKCFDLAVKRGTIQNITWEEVLADHPGIHFLSNDHVFRTMKKKGLLTDSDYFSFLKTNFKGVPVPKKYEHPAVEQVISVIRRAGGVPILAHPGLGNQFHLVPQLVEMGLLGIETLHAEHRREDVIQAEELAKTFGLYESGGTDHSGVMGGQYRFFRHPEQTEYWIPPGVFGATEEDFRKMKERALG